MILYFSGTGNSRYVAEQLGEQLGESLRPLTPAMRGATIVFDGPDENIIWVFPVYSWGVPPYVLSLIAAIDLVALTSPVHHAVMTCGDDCGLADRMWRKAIARRGWATGGGFSVQMPNNYVAMKGFDVDPKDVEAAKLAAAPARIKEVSIMLQAAEATGQQVTDIVKGSFAWIKTRIIYPWFVRHAMSPARFGVTDACIGCGKCATTCPLGNIDMIRISRDHSSLQTSMPHDTPSWGNDCAGCLACYHVCPTHAVTYGSATRGKGQYFLK